MESNSVSERRQDALWDDERAYAFIDELFNDPVFLSVAQGSIHNHGTPVNLRRFEENFSNLMERWSKKPPKLADLRQS